MNINENDRQIVEDYLIEKFSPIIERFCVEVESDALAAYDSEVMVASVLNPFTRAKVKKRWSKVVDTVQSTTKRMFKDTTIDVNPILQVVESMDLPSSMYERVSNVLAQGANEGWSKQFMLDQLGKITGKPAVIAGGIAVGLATAITATVALRAMRKNRVKYKMWRSLHDSRVRDTHAIADGQIQLESDPFTVGGALLDYPGDPSGPAGEVINCRCVVIGVNRDGQPISLSAGDDSITSWLILSP